jgi:hypothetical protein
MTSFFERGGSEPLQYAVLAPPRSKTILLARMGKEDVEGEGAGGVRSAVTR